MFKLIHNLYDSIELNLGIKRVFFRNKFVWFFKKNWPYYRCLFETKAIYPIYELLGRYFYKRIVDHYGADYYWDNQKSQNLDKKHFNLGYGYIHYAMVRSQRPRRVLCIGSMYGFIPYMLARACMENKRGHVDFVDASYDINNPKHKGIHNYGQGFWKKTEIGKHFSYLLSNKYISTYVMTSESFAKKYKRKYDYICLDGDHTYKGARKDFRLFWPKLNKEGFLCFHDIHFREVSKGIHFEYWKIWDELKKKYKFKFELSNHYSGLGFIQKI